MVRKRNLIWFPLALFIGSLSSLSLNSKAGITSGADIYCVMRLGDNDHESSWQAAYQNIKKQKAGLFKTSPTQAASMIVEEVVSEPDKYQDCIKYLGELYIPKNPPNQKLEEVIDDSKNTRFPETKGNYNDRYSY